MRHQRSIDSFVDHFHESLHRVAELPDDLYLKVLKKLGFVATIDALSKVRLPNLGGRERFVSFVRQFSCWDDGERMSLPHLAYALSRDTQPEFQPLKEWAHDSLQRWPSRGNHPSPWWIDRDPMPAEMLDLWPSAGKVLGKLTLEKFSHAHLLYSRRNSLAHELRTGVSEAGESNYEHPYYRRTKSGGCETWMLHYPIGFLLTLASTCLQKLEEWLKSNDTNPYESYKRGEFMLQELIEVEETASPAADV
jgi:hypothetical protein